METTARIEALIMICAAGAVLSFIVLFMDIPPEIRMLAFVSTFLFTIMLLFLVFFNVHISFKDESPISDRTLPYWSNLGFFMLSIGVFFYQTPILGISIILTGLVIILYAIHYRESKNQDEVEYDTNLEIIEDEEGYQID